MSWEMERSMLSPKEERQFWLSLLARYPFGMAVNCRGMPSLERTPMLRKLIEEGKIIRVRENRQWGKNNRQSSGKRTILRLPE
ncbi:hypothetical protein ISREJYDI_CDS0184 [Pseudomonas phage UNO-G1W1]|uniref:Uncharacterized protein n=1 Tax=Pseudomonas phage UNO-G1W1 TaxID=3136609 RepID=A0AAX4MVM7_9CAUD